MGTVSATHCYYAYSCAEGVYTATCSLIPGNAVYNCSCSNPDGSAQGFTLGAMSPPCDQAAELCWFNPATLE
jgi:hypothetical protein